MAIMVIGVGSALTNLKWRRWLQTLMQGWRWQKPKTTTFVSHTDFARSNPINVDPDTNDKAVISRRVDMHGEWLTI